MIFFFLLIKLPLPSCGTIRFFLSLPFCSWHLFNRRQKNIFFSSQLPYQENPTGIAAAFVTQADLQEKHLNSNRKDYTPTTPTREQKGDSSIVHRIIHTGEGKPAPFKWEQSVRTWIDLPPDAGYQRKEVAGDALCYNQPNIPINNHQNDLPVTPLNSCSSSLILWGTSSGSYSRRKSAWLPKPFHKANKGLAVPRGQGREDWFTPLDSS